MSRKKNTKDRACLISGGDTCIAKRFLSEPEDSPNILAGLGCRCGLAWITWLMLGSGISVGNSFFVAIFLYAFPLFIDTTKFKPHNLFRKKLRRYLLILFTVVFVFDALGIANVISIVQGEAGLLAQVSSEYIVLQGSAMNASIIWVVLVVFPVATVIDWIYNTTPFEIEEINNT